MTTELVHSSLLKALRWIDSTNASGSLRVAGENPGALFFDQGRLYFATLDDTPMTGTELVDAGIDRGRWQMASTRPGARLRFVDELLAVGCDRSSIERFIVNRLTTAIDHIGLGSGPVQIGTGRHGFGAAVSFRPDQVAQIDADVSLNRPAINEDSLVSLGTVAASSSVTIDGRTWNSLTQLLTPARYAEISQRLGLDDTAALTLDLSTRGLLNVVESHQPADPWAETSVTVAEEDPPTPTPLKASLFDDRPARVTIDDSDDSDEYVPDKVGRQAYAAMASMRASAAEPPPQDKARALRRLIEAVKGL